MRKDYIMDHPKEIHLCMKGKFPTSELSPERTAAAKR